MQNSDNLAQEVALAMAACSGGKRSLERSVEGTSSGSDIWHFSGLLGPGWSSLH